MLNFADQVVGFVVNALETSVQSVDRALFIVGKDFLSEDAVIEVVNEL